MSCDRPEVEEFERGNTVTIDATFSDSNNTVVEPDDTRAFITIEDLDTGEVMVGPDTTMTNVSDTEYRYQWHTTEGMTEGEYMYEAKAEISSNDVLNRDRLSLEDIITED